MDAIFCGVIHDYSQNVLKWETEKNQLIYIWYWHFSTHFMIFVHTGHNLEFWTYHIDLPSASFTFHLDEDKVLLERSLSQSLQYPENWKSAAIYFTSQWGTVQLHLRIACFENNQSEILTSIFLKIYVGLVYLVLKAYWNKECLLFTTDKASVLYFLGNQ